MDWEVSTDANWLNLNTTSGVDNQTARVAIVAGTAGPKAPKMNVYPVPARTTVSIDWEKFSQASLYDLSGKRVLTSNSNQIDVQTLTPGLYILRAEGTDGEIEKKKILIQ